MAAKRVRHRHSLSKEGWCPQLDQLALLFVLHGNEMKFEDIMNATFHSLSGCPAFPSSLRQYANQRVQKLRNKSNRGSDNLPTIDDSLPSFFESNKFIDQLFARKRLHDMDDDSSEESLRSVKYNLRNNERLRKTLNSMSPPRHNIDRSIMSQPKRDPAGALALINSSDIDANPFGLWVTIGDTPRLTDAGDRFTNWMEVTYQLRCPADGEHTNLKIVMTEDNQGCGHSLLKFSYPAKSKAQMNDYKFLEGLIEVDVMSANNGNARFRSNLAARVDKREAQLAEVVPASENNIKSVLLRLPIDPATGSPYLCHNLYWQGKTYLDVTLPEPGFLLKHEASVEGLLPELATFGDGTGQAVTRHYLQWLIPISGAMAEGNRLPVAGAAQPAISDADRVMLAARVLAGMAII